MSLDTFIHFAEQKKLLEMSETPVWTNWQELRILHLFDPHTGSQFFYWHVFDIGVGEAKWSAIERSPVRFSAKHPEENLRSSTGMKNYTVGTLAVSIAQKESVVS
jgi:hypothetical protein